MSINVSINASINSNSTFSSAVLELFASGGLLTRAARAERLGDSIEKAPPIVVGIVVEHNKSSLESKESRERWRLFLTDNVLIDCGSRGGAHGRSQLELSR